MAGLVKAKKLLWKDTNLEFFGSDTEKQVSAEGRIVLKLLTDEMVLNSPVNSDR